MKPGDLVEYITSKNERHVGVIINVYEEIISNQSYRLIDIYIHGCLIKGVYAHINLIKLVDDSYNDVR